MNLDVTPDLPVTPAESSTEEVASAAGREGATRGPSVEHYLITASAALIDALLVARGTPIEHEIRSYLHDLYALEARAR